MFIGQESILNKHAIDINELINAEIGALPPVTRLLHSAKRHPRVGADVCIDEAQTGFELVSCNSFAALKIPGDDPRAEAEPRLIGDADRAGFIAQFVRSQTGLGAEGAAAH